MKISRRVALNGTEFAVAVPALFSKRIQVVANALVQIWDKRLGSSV